jgi:USP8 interacting
LKNSFNQNKHPESFICSVGFSSLIFLYNNAIIVMTFKKWLTPGIILTFIFLNGCLSGSFLYDGKKLKEVYVSDMAELYSTYKLTREDKKEIATQLTNQTLLESISTYSLEENWPISINTLNKRLNERANLKLYHFFKIATCGNKTILAIPADKNRHMPQGFVPASTIYMIFKSSAITEKRGS